MKSHPAFVITTFVITLWITACRQEVQPTLVEPVDSLLLVKLPDVKVVAAKSVTPSGRLNQFVAIRSIRYSPNSGVYNDSVRTQFLYDSLGRITGYQRFSFGQVVTTETEAESVARQGEYGTIYEYKDNLPYRVFSKSFNDQVKPRVVYYLMTEFVYRSLTDSHPSSKLEYYVDATGKARLTARYRMLYNPAGHLTESKDVNGYFLNQLYTYHHDNVVRAETIDPKTPKRYSHREYDYDDRPNPLRGFFWDGNADNDHIHLSANNLVRARTVDYSSTHVEPATQYTIAYDNRNRILRRTIIINNSIEDIGRSDWVYRYAN